MVLLVQGVAPSEGTDMYGVICCAGIMALHYFITIFFDVAQCDLSFEGNAFVIPDSHHPVHQCSLTWIPKHVEGDL